MYPIAEGTTTCVLTTINNIACLVFLVLPTIPGIGEWVGVHWGISVCVGVHWGISECVGVQLVSVWVYNHSDIVCECVGVQSFTHW